MFSRYGIGNIAMTFLDLFGFVSYNYLLNFFSVLGLNKTIKFGTFKYRLEFVLWTCIWTHHNLNGENWLDLSFHLYIYVGGIKYNMARRDRLMLDMVSYSSIYNII